MSCRRPRSRARRARTSLEYFHFEERSILVDGSRCKCAASTRDGEATNDDLRRERQPTLRHPTARHARTWAARLRTRGDGHRAQRHWQGTTHLRPGARPVKRDNWQRFCFVQLLEAEQAATAAPHGDGTARGACCTRVSHAAVRRRTRPYHRRYASAGTVCGAYNHAATTASPSNVKPPSEPEACLRSKQHAARAKHRRRALAAFNISVKTASINFRPRSQAATAWYRPVRPCTAALLFARVRARDC